MAPSLGLFGLNQTAEPRATITRIGPLAEELGYDSIWFGEHVVAPDPHVKPSPMQPTDPILDGAVGLSFLAGITERIRLATGIVILPQRNPLVLAKQLATLDVLSGGRFIFGMGVGYVEPEMSAIGVPMERRGTRADEYLAAMRALWEEERPSYEGEFVSFSNVNAYPRPVQTPLPVMVGGHTRPALRRAARTGQGWYGFWRDRERSAKDLAGLEEELAAAGRSRSDIEIVVTPGGSLNEAEVAAYGELGVDRLVPVVPFTRSVDEIEQWVRDHAPERLGAAAS
jgi:probable F420-dependent oxidoreductase